MTKHSIENMIIISSYDDGYTFSVMIDGTLLAYDDKRFKDIFYAFGTHKSYDEIYELQKKYNRDILICEDGHIEFYPIKK